jgi:hypothetical protein
LELRVFASLCDDDNMFKVDTYECGGDSSRVISATESPPRIRVKTNFPVHGIENAWCVHERPGDIGDPNDSSRFLLDKIAEMMRGSERHRLVLSNLAIDAYRRRHQPLQLVA